MYDGSINCQRKEGRRKVAAGRDYSVELVSPILTYREDIETLQELVESFAKLEPLQIHLAEFTFI